MKLPCGCCEGIQVVTPVGIWNRPGLDSLTYRVGTHSTFLETMLARISNVSISIPATNPGDLAKLVYPLSALTTRDTTDPAIALLDAWAVVADVLTFYQERIANEAYLRTAIERRSILELARLIGYRLRPGVSASVFLAFTLQQGNVVDIPPGTQAQSVPGPGELPQYFETSAILPARDVWNSLQVRLTRPQLITYDGDPVYDVHNIDTIWFEGTSTNLSPNDPLLIAFDDGSNTTVLRRVETVTPDSDNKRTKVTLQLMQSLSQSESTLQSQGKTILTQLDAAISDGQKNFPGTGMAETIVAALSDLRDTLSSAMQDNDVEAFLSSLRKNVAFLREQYAVAEDRNYTRLEPWIQNMLANLETNLATFTSIAMSAMARSSARHPARAVSGSAGTPLRSSERSDHIVSEPLRRLSSLLGPLSLPPSLQPANSARLPRAIPQSFRETNIATADGTPRVLKLLRPGIGSQLYKAWANVSYGALSFHVYAFRVQAPLFGHNAPKKVITINESGEITQVQNWPVVETPPSGPSVATTKSAPDNITHENASVVSLDNSYNKVVAGSWVVVKTSQTSLTGPGSIVYARAKDPVLTVSRADYGITGNTTKIELADPANPSNDLTWITVDLKTVTPDFDNDFEAIRTTTVYAQSEELALAEAPICEDVAGSEIELAQLYDGLDSGRWVIVSGQRTDTPGVTGVTANELVMLSAVNQGFGSVWEAKNVSTTPPGEKIHTTIVLANDLAYNYDRKTLTIYANVTKATHGKSQAEALGSGDGSKTLQSFPLHQPPLTYLPAPTPAGAASTLQIRVNDILWHEVDNLTLMAAGDHSYVTKADNNDVTSAIFGTGTRGSRLPTGPENVKAAYRNGIGAAGNVDAQQISQLVTRPLGVKDVINPLPATGGADRDSITQARSNAPLAVMSLDRIVSVQDYADFARTFAGIGKASSARFFGPGASLVHVTVAGVDDIPIATSSDLYINLVQALRQNGDPYEAIQVDVRSLILLIISAGVRVSDVYLWEKVEPNIRAALAAAFGFENRDLGQDALLSAVISTIQATPGVEYVDVDGFGGVSDTNPDGSPIDPATLLSSIHNQLFATDGTPIPPKHRVRALLEYQDKNGIHPAQLAYLSPGYPDSLILKETTK